MTYKLDANHGEIVLAFEQLGATVFDNAKVKRYDPDQPDIWVGLSNPYEGLGCWIAVEIKTLTGRLSPGQAKLAKELAEKSLPYEIVRSTKGVEHIYYTYLALMRDGEFNTCPECGNAIPVDAYICDECIPF